MPSRCFRVRVRAWEVNENLIGSINDDSQRQQRRLRVHIHSTTNMLWVENIFYAADYVPEISTKPPHLDAFSRSAHCRLCNHIRDLSFAMHGPLILIVYINVWFAHKAAGSIRNRRSHTQNNLPCNRWQCFAITLVAAVFCHHSSTAATATEVTARRMHVECEIYHAQ